jgi:LysM repeat protein
VSYTAPANSTLAKVAALFGVSDIDSLLGANDFNLSTPATLALSPGDFLKVPVTCNCINGKRQSNSTIYEVMAGDTLSVIAGTTYQGLITYQQIGAANGIVDVNKILIGQLLVIPFPCGCNPVSDQPVVYLAYPVQSGDRIANISADFGAHMADILSLNGIANASDLQVGSVLEVPIPGL